MNVMCPFVSVDCLQVHDMSNHVVLITDPIRAQHVSSNTSYKHTKESFNIREEQGWTMD